MVSAWNNLTMKGALNSLMGKEAKSAMFQKMFEYFGLKIIDNGRSYYIRLN